MIVKEWSTTDDQNPARTLASYLDTVDLYLEFDVTIGEEFAIQIESLGTQTLELQGSLDGVLFTPAAGFPVSATTTDYASGVTNPVVGITKIPCASLKKIRLRVTADTSGNVNVACATLGRLGK